MCVRERARAREKWTYGAAMIKGKFPLVNNTVILTWVQYEKRYIYRDRVIMMMTRVIRVAIQWY